MKAFKVIFHLKRHAALIDDIYLDSLISAAKCKEIVKENYFTDSKQAGDISLIRQTLDPIIARQYDVYKCSKLFFKDETGVANYVKRFENKYDSYINTTKKIDTQRGFFKAAFNSVSYYTDLNPYAFCEGDFGEIKRLLTENIFFIGKKASQGYGLIDNIELEEIEEFPWIHNNQLVRNVPAKYADEFKCDFDYAEIPVISPYWRKERELCVY